MTKEFRLGTVTKFICALAAELERNLRNLQQSVTKGILNCFVIFRSWGCICMLLFCVVAAETKENADAVRQVKQAQGSKEQFRHGQFSTSLKLLHVYLFCSRNIRRKDRSTLGTLSAAKRSGQ